MILSLKERSKLFDDILDYRLNHTLKEMMSETGVDCWITISKEYNEDPHFKYLVPSSYLTARRLTILIFYYDGEEVKRYCDNMKDEELEKYYTNIYKANSDQYQLLNDLLLKLNPSKIAINISKDYAYFDGLSHSLYQNLEEKLDEKLKKRFISSKDLGIRFIETRTEKELKLYKEAVDLSLSIIEEAFSLDVIKIGETSTDDLEWFMKEKIKSYGLDYWFDPDVNLQNDKSLDPMQKTIIQKGDLLHCDFGLVYCGLHTDIQRLCYILKDDEDEVPKELLEAFEENLSFHEIVKNNFILGRSGNEILLNSLKDAKDNNIEAMLYTHPIGNFGHSVGPTIGLFSNQTAIYPSGELKLNDHTCYALELNTKKYLKMYGHMCYIFTEESTVFKDGELAYISNNHPKLYSLKEVSYEKD